MPLQEFCSLHQRYHWQNTPCPSCEAENKKKREAPPAPNLPPKIPVGEIKAGKAWVRPTETEFGPVLNELYAAAQKLDALLQPYAKMLEKAGTKPLAEASISEKVNMAKLLIRIKEDATQHRQ